MSLTQSTAMKLACRVLLYLGIAVSFLLACGLFAAIAIYIGRIREVPVGWFGLAGFTPLVFWGVIKSLRNCWDRPTFWLAVMALLLLHVLAFVGVLVRYPRWPLLWFIPISFVEVGVFVMVLGKLFIDKRSRM